MHVLISGYHSLYQRSNHILLMPGLFVVIVSRIIHGNLGKMLHCVEMVQNLRGMNCRNGEGLIYDIDRKGDAIIIRGIEDNSAVVSRIKVYLYCKPLSTIFLFIHRDIE